MKYKLLKNLYDCFYTPPEFPTQKREIEECHQTLSEVLGKPERRLALQIIDAKDRIVEDTSIDSFAVGFELAWRLSTELNHYDNERPVRRQAAKKLDARFTFKNEEDDAASVLLSEEPSPAVGMPQPEPEFAAPQLAIELQLGDEHYIPGFGWVEYEGPNHCEDGTDIYENGNKIGIMG